MLLNSSVREDGEIRITTGDRVTIETAADFSRILTEALEASDRVSIEFESGTSLDMTALQAFCAACKSATASGKMLFLHGSPPASLQELITTMGAERNSGCKQNKNSSCIWLGGGN